jgi:hypothetical protein
VLRDSRLRDSLRDLGRKRSQQLTWEASAARLNRYFYELL